MEGPETPAPDAPRGGTRLPLLLCGIAAAVVTADQVTKTWAVRALAGRDPVEVVDGVVRLRLVRNAGAAFSFATGTGMTWVFTVLAVAVSVVILRIARRLGNAWWALALGLMLGGAMGNLVDRLFRAPGPARGHVVDFVELPHWPVFNVADSALVSAAVLIAWLGLRGIDVDGRRVGE